MTGPSTDLQLSQSTLAKFAEMTTALEAYPVGGMDSILEQLWKADNVDDYNKIFEGDRGMPLNTELKITRVRYAKSDFDAGLPFYLVCDTENPRTGEAREYTVGATEVVGALVYAAFANHLPCIGMAAEASKQTEAGYTPVNWKMLAITKGQLPVDDKPKAAK